MNLTMAIPIAKQSVCAAEVAKALGLHPDRYGRCACPIHGGKDRNMKLFGGDKGYYCFVCHAVGDVIDLVSNVNGCDNRGAVEWLDRTFGLGLNIGGQTDRKRMDETRRRIARQNAQRKWNEEYSRELFDAQLDALTVSMEIDLLIDATRPRRTDDEFPDDFCAALAAREEMREVTEDLNAMAWEEWERSRQ